MPHLRVRLFFMRKKMNTKVEVNKAGEEEGHVHGPNCNHGHSHESLEPIKRSSPKVGRNDPCSCGSQKKYKKCCGK
jgi:uncharacterized protein YecA (UPF0149 family)